MKSIFIKSSLLGVILTLGSACSQEGPNQVSGDKETVQQDISKSADSQVVSTLTGKVEGSRAGDIIVFKGIPYAQPPVGENRWRSPQPMSP